MKKTKAPDSLTAFFYLLMRDSVPVGIESAIFSNKPLAQYARQCAERLLAERRDGLKTKINV